jgi:MoaA/NifB/PqqE/SkfB family radical SAM enzyme
MIKDLRLVEIELFSYCNRRCNWCPNRDIDRHSKNIEINDEVLTKLLLELKKEGYENPITFSRYNEPTSHIDILNNRLKLIREILPSNKLITNTNGDYLSEEVLNLPLDEITIMDYDKIGMQKCINKLIEAGATIGKLQYPYIYAHKGNMKILYFVDWLEKKSVIDRGGVLKEYTSDARTSSCYEPSYFIGVNYDGTISPCCNIRNDIDKLKAYTIGDLNTNSLSEILECDKAISFKSNCANGNFEIGSPCYTCANKGGRYTSGKAGIKYE